MLAKHSKHLNLVDILAVGVDRMQRNFEPMRKQVEVWHRPLPGYRDPHVGDLSEIETMTKTDAVVNAGEFRVSCDAGKPGRFLAETGALWVRVGQRVLRNRAQEIWDSISVEAKKEQDGTLVVRVLVFNPDWDEPLQIACIRSRPNDPACLAPLGCNLDHVAL